MYKIVDHIFVHTTKMKTQLIEEFGIDQEKISVIPFDLNYISPKSNLNSVEARTKLGLGRNDKVILFFGQIAQYKGIDYLIRALYLLKIHLGEFKLIIAGKVKRGQEQYWIGVKKLIKILDLENYILSKTEFVPEGDIELYFKAADVLVLPYRNIFQTGVLFLAYDFGLPVVATDVGSLKEDIFEGDTGFICEAENPEALAKAIWKYYRSPLFEKLNTTREYIARFAAEKYSWKTVGEKTRSIYEEVM
jgi:glycosyltransferase involved in cell wall biosynthesis